MYYLVHIPLYLYLGLVVIYQHMSVLPWPSITDIFKGIIDSFISFKVLCYPRYKLDKVARQKYLHDHKRKPAPTSTEHQQAAAAVGALFEHH
jgi:hypothetical protein